MSGHIQTVSLSGMLPRVFTRDNVPDSQVWLAELELHRGTMYRVEAASGAGKSSLCSYIYGVRRDYGGTLRFDGRDARTLTVPEWQELRRGHLAYLPQELSLFDELTAWENIQLKNRLTGWKSDREIEEWLERLGIAGKRDNAAGRLSVGQRQRVALVRALCQPFDFLLLDEPVSHLDEWNNRLAAQLVAEEAARQGAAVVTTSVGNPLLLPDTLNIRL